MRDSSLACVQRLQPCALLTSWHDTKKEQQGKEMSSKVLVVEDEIFVATELENLLYDLGHQPVGIAADSRQALALADQADMAFVDINLLDGPTGIEVGRSLASRGVTVVYMTANPSQLGDGVPGTVGVIPKPVEHSELRQAVEFAAALHAKQAAATPPRRLRLFGSPGAQAFA
ncbi:response regulator [Devosia sp.]|uniref:response regulator n=1 Tax=Devosia sp. TaxID=1871048 RepID=UPI0025BB8C01|nr:response regulator [Devosia sp.]